MSGLGGKCWYKCAVTDCPSKYYTGIKDPNYKNKRFFTIPRKDLVRRALWFKIMGKEFTHKRLYLCEDHFAEEAFSSTLRTKLNLGGLPSLKLGPGSTIVDPRSLYRKDDEIFIVRSSPPAVQDNKPPVDCDLILIVDGDNNNPPATENDRFALISDTIEKTRSPIIPKKMKLFYEKVRRRMKFTLRKNMPNRIQKLNALHKISNANEFVNDVEQSIDSAIASSIHYFRNSAKKRARKKTSQNKRNESCLGHIMMSFEPGLDVQFLNEFARKIQSFKSIARNCILTYRYIPITEKLVYNKKVDNILGYVDMGPLGRDNEFANRALVFMVSGLSCKWKLPVGYFLTREDVTTKQLLCLIKHVINTLEGVVGLRIMCIIFDPKRQNRLVVKLLCKHSLGRTYFSINNHKVFTIFDPTHLLVHTMHALKNFTIQYNSNRYAKMLDIKKSFSIDELRQYKTLNQIRKEYLYGDKICKKAALKIFTRQVAVSIESAIMMSCNNKNGLARSAMETAEFVNDIALLYDSFNGNNSTSESSMQYRTCLSQKSHHIKLWQKLMPKILSWKFINVQNGAYVELPIKSAWLTTIAATQELWTLCSSLGIKHLPICHLSLDALNTSNLIKNHLRQHTKPTCRQFRTALKNNIINNLKLKHKHHSCDNFATNDNAVVSDVPMHKNEIELAEFPILNLNLTARDFDIIDKFAVFVFKNIKYYQKCSQCNSDFTPITTTCSHNSTSVATDAEDTSIDHNYYKKQVHGIRRNILIELAKLYEYTLFLLPKFGHIDNLLSKLKTVLSKRVTMNWYKCDDHREYFANQFLDVLLVFLIKGFFEQNPCHSIQKYKKQFEMSFSSDINKLLIYKQ